MAIKLTEKTGSVDLSQKMYKGDPGGYYTPTVSEDGNLSWLPSEEGMAPVEDANVMGPQGEKGDSGIWKDSSTPPEGYDVWIDPSGQATESLATIEYVDNAIAEIELMPGPQGEKGEKGDPGEDGAPGQDGQDGVTPVKGVDYWTETDKQEIVDDVLASLPAAESVSV